MFTMQLHRDQLENAYKLFKYCITIVWELGLNKFKATDTDMTCISSAELWVWQNDAHISNEWHTKEFYLFTELDVNNVVIVHQEHSNTDLCNIDAMYVLVFILKNKIGECYTIFLKQRSHKNCVFDVLL